MVITELLSMHLMHLLRHKENTQIQSVKVLEFFSHSTHSNIMFTNVTQLYTAIVAVSLT